MFLMYDFDESIARVQGCSCGMSLPHIRTGRGCPNARPFDALLLCTLDTVEVSSVSVRADLLLLPLERGLEDVVVGGRPKELAEEARGGHVFGGVLAQLVQRQAHRVRLAAAQPHPRRRKQRAGRHPVLRLILVQRLRLFRLARLRIDARLRGAAGEREQPTGVAIEGLRSPRRAGLGSDPSLDHAVQEEQHHQLLETLFGQNTYKVLGKLAQT
jgi:hypothetical protein